ncbi:MAG: hypothetical protein Greene041679_191 [Parcubacteria group bacterium Greene0416_79]|nr:MAG: hypothetical protein Greene041679_191 [Parcubacteria group bacterium Greene0416_79]
MAERTELSVNMKENTVSPMPADEAKVHRNRIIFWVIVTTIATWILLLLLVKLIEDWKASRGQLGKMNECAPHAAEATSSAAFSFGTLNDELSPRIEGEGSNVSVLNPTKFWRIRDNVPSLTLPSKENGIPRAPIFLGMRIAIHGILSDSRESPLKTAQIHGFSAVT